jgi:hypothetical protein
MSFQQVICLTRLELSLFHLLYDVPRESVLGPLLFILYTALLSAVVA